MGGGVGWGVGLGIWFDPALSRAGVDITEKVNAEPSLQCQSPQTVVSHFLKLSWRERMRAKKESCCPRPWVIPSTWDTWNTKEAGTVAEQTLGSCRGKACYEGACLGDSTWGHMQWTQPRHGLRWGVTLEGGELLVGPHSNPTAPVQPG